MGNKRVAILQGDVTRLIKGALKAGISADRISGIKATPGGPVLLLGEFAPLEAVDKNEWDEVLDK